MNNYCLVAAAFSRRQVALAIFKNTHLEYVKTRQLGSLAAQAQKTVIGLLSWAHEHFEVHALAVVSPKPRTRGSELQQLAIGEARRFGLPVWEVNPQQLFACFGHPTLKSKARLREVASTLWPILKERSVGRLTPDAAAAGLYVQVERMFAAAGERQTR